MRRQRRSGVKGHMKGKPQQQTSYKGTTNRVKEQENGSNDKKVHMQGKRQSQTSDKGTAKSTQHAIRARFYRKTLAQRNGALVADVVIPKVNACEGLVDLRTRKQKNAAWSMVTGVKHQAKVAINVGTDDKKVHMQRKIATTK